MRCTQRGAGWVPLSALFQLAPLTHLTYPHVSVSLYPYILALAPLPRFHSILIKPPAPCTPRARLCPHVIPSLGPQQAALGVPPGLQGELW